MSYNVYQKQEKQYTIGNNIWYSTGEYRMGREIATNLESCGDYVPWIIAFDFNGDTLTYQVGLRAVTSYTFTAEASPYEENLRQYSFLTEDPSNLNNMFANTTITQLHKMPIWPIASTESMFENCTLLTGGDGVETLTMNNCTTAKRMFANCSGLTSLDLSKWRTNRLQIMDDMFVSCKALKSLNLSNWSSGNLLRWDGWLSGLRDDIQIKVDNWQFSNIAPQVGELFKDVREKDTFKTFNFASWNITQCYSLASMFSYCSGLTSLDLSSWNTSEVTDMGSMFYSCYQLSSLNVAGWNTSKVANMSYMFASCGGLKTLDLSSWDVSEATNMENMFKGCGLHLKFFKKTPSTLPQLSTIFQSGVTSLDINSWDTSNITDATKMFNWCNTLTAVTCTKIGSMSNVTTMENMFADCRTLTSLDISGFDTSNVTSMRFMFYDCLKLKSLDLSNFDTSNVTDMDGMFYDCRSLTSLDLSGWDLTNVTNYSRMFSGCNSLQYIYVCGCNQATIDKITSAKPTNAEILFSQYVFNNEYVCDSELDMEQNGYKYEIWREVDCQDNSTYTGNVEYRNPQPSCDCGWTGLTWVFNNEYINGSEIPSTISYITNYDNGSILNTSIDTGIKASTNLRMQIEYTRRDRSGGCLIGVGGEHYRYFNYDGNSGMYFDIASGGASGSQRIFKANSSTIGTRYNIEVGNYYIKNLDTNTNIATGTPQNYSYEYNVRLFGLSSIGGSQSGADGADVYSFRIYENEVLVRDYIPYEENGIVGMWDKVEGRFYAPEGADNLIAVYNTWDENSKYEIWREAKECDVTDFTGNVEYRNPQP